MLVIDGLPETTFLLSIIYGSLALLASRRLLWLEIITTRAEMNTKKMFVMTCFLVTILRFVSFASITVMNFQNFHFASLDLSTTEVSTSDASNPSGSALTSLYDKANIVLFDLPDFCCISAYVLLLVVWAEAYLKSRQHWLSTRSFRRHWLLGYLIFNTALYTIQVALYFLLFVPSIDPTYLSFWIYAVLTAINLCLPLIWAAGFLYLTFVFSGFPMSSAAAKLRLSTLSRVGAIWTLSRIGWGLVALSTVMQGWLLELGGQSPILYGMLLLLIFLLAEVLPLWLSLQESTIQALAAAVRAQSVSFAPGVSMLGVQTDQANYQALDPSIGLQLSSLSRALGVVPEIDPSYNSPHQVTRKRFAGSGSSGSDYSPSNQRTSAVRHTETEPSGQDQQHQGFVGSDRAIHTPSPGALAALRHQQGKHLLGRPLHKDAYSDSSGRCEEKASRRMLVLPRPSIHAISLGNPADEEWSGDEESGALSMDESVFRARTLVEGTALPRVLSSPTRPTGRNGAAANEGSALLGSATGGTGLWGWVMGV